MLLDLENRHGTRNIKKGKRSCWEIWFVEWRSWHIIRSLTDHRRVLSMLLRRPLAERPLFGQDQEKEQKNVSATHESFFARWQLTFLTMEQILGCSAGQSWPSYLKVERKNSNPAEKLIGQKTSFLDLAWNVSISWSLSAKNLCDCCKPFLIWSFWGSYFGEFYFDTWNYCPGWAIFYALTLLIR